MMMLGKFQNRLKNEKVKFDSIWHFRITATLITSLTCPTPFFKRRFGHFSVQIFIPSQGLPNVAKVQQDQRQTCNRQLPQATHQILTIAAALHFCIRRTARTGATQDLGGQRPSFWRPGASPAVFEALTTQASPGNHLTCVKCVNFIYQFQSEYFLEPARLCHVPPLHLSDL